MTLVCRGRRRGEQGYALLVTMGMVGIMIVLISSVLALTSSEGKLTSRNNTYQSSVAAAEAATEMVVAQMDRDFLAQSVSTDLSVYRNITPSSVQTNWPLQFEFSDGGGNIGLTDVESMGPTVLTNLNSQFAGLYGWVMPYRVTSQARAMNGYSDVSAAVRQDIQLASIPVFQFAIFYTLNLEINPGPNMTITGKVHSNGNIYTAPVNKLVYEDDVTYSGSFYFNRDPADPQYGMSKTTPIFDLTNSPAQSSSLTLPVSTNNNASSVQEILKPPPQGEDPNSEMGRQRYYNKSDLIVTTTANGVSVTTGEWDNFAPVSPDTTNAMGVPGYSFLTTTNSFTDFRENKSTVETDVDVGALNAWMMNTNRGGQINNSAQSLLGHSLDSIYVNDTRSVSSKLTAVRVVNGAALPKNGLTVATQQPLYVKGNFNLNNGDTSVGQTDTAMTKPSSLVGDAVTFLSQNWKDNYSTSGTAQNRPAANTTVNAAVISGIVSTVANHYSGGVENFPRFLEDWGNSTLTYNGSMVVMFNSRFATNYWVGPAASAYYVAPTRAWAFDVNFLNQAKLPPGTPQLRKLVRGQWSVVALY